MKTSITTASLFLALAFYSNHVMAQIINQTSFDFTQQTNLSTTMTINWSIHQSGHTRYCGPRTVGGYATAVKYCSPQTACGLSGPVAGVYGGNGNDCKGRNYFDVESGVGSTSWMCFSDIECVVPTEGPSVMPTISPSESMRPSGGVTEGPSGVPSVSFRPSVSDKTGVPSKFPSISPSITPSKAPTKPPSTSPTSTPTIQPNTFQPTGSPVEISTIKLRGYFCGTTYQNAVEDCNASKSCNSHKDCEEGEKCFPNVSCEFVQSKASVLGDHVDVVVVNEVDDRAEINADISDENADGDEVLNFSNDGASNSSFGFACGVKGSLVLLIVSVTYMMFMCTVLVL